jgi:hypothetical protein
VAARVNLLGVMLALIGLSAATLAARLLGLDLAALIALQPEPPAFLSGLAVFAMLFGPLTVVSGILILLGVRASRRPFMADPGLGAALVRLFGPEFVRAAPPLGGGTMVAGVWIAARAYQTAPTQDLTSLGVLVLQTLVAVAGGVWVLGLGVEAARAEAIDEAAATQKPWWRRAAFLYPGLAALALIGVTKGVEVGLFLLVVPGLLMLAAPYLLLYLPMVDLPLFALRAAGARWLAAMALLAASLPALATPYIVDQWLADDPRLATAGDVAPTPTPFRPRRIAVYRDPGPGRCGWLCARLIGGGSMRELLILHDGRKAGDPKTALLVRPMRARRCDLIGEALPGRPGWCAVIRPAPDARYDTLVEFGVFPDTKSAQSVAAAPFATLPAQAEPGEGFDLMRWLDKPTQWSRITVWTCDTGCRLAARQTFADQGPLRTPLQFNSDIFWGDGRKGYFARMDAPAPDFGGVLEKIFGFDVTDPKGAPAETLPAGSPSSRHAQD